MAYSETLLDHFQHPRNTGQLDGSNAVADGENPICGDRLRIEMRVEDGVIVAVRWSAEGCPPAIAAASAASELLQGLSLQDARSLDRATLTAALGGVPERKAHAVSLVLGTVAQALDRHAPPS